MKIFTRILWTAALLLATSAAAPAQGRGNLTGKVVDQQGNVLPGATIVVEGTTLGTSTDMNGLYTLRGVEAGSREIKVSYLGYDKLVQAVQIARDRTTSADFALNQSGIGIGEVVVSAIVDGQQRALNQQRAADNMMQVLSADQMGKFPDLNVAEALQRLSGVTITRSRGEGAEVQLRGTPANFVNINVNGEQLMGVQDNGRRNATLDIIPSDILASMEVQKTLLPSNDGDAIAGVINMRTATARSLSPRFTLDLGSGYNMLREKAPWSVKGSYQQRFFPSSRNPEGTFGIAANVSRYHTYNGYDRLEAQAWVPADGKTIYGLDGKTKTKLPEGEYIPSDFRYRYQEGVMNRTGAALTLDWAPTQSTRFTLNGMFTDRHEIDTRYRNRFRVRGDLYQMVDGGYGTDRAAFITQTTYQNMRTQNWNLNLDGETTIGTWGIDGGASYSRSERNTRNSQYNFNGPDWRAGKKVEGFDIPKGTVIAEIPELGAKYLALDPVYQPAGGVAINDPSYFLFNEVLDDRRVATGSNTTFRLNVSKDYFLGDFASRLQFGAKAKLMWNENHSNPDGGIYAADKSPLADFLYRDVLTTDFLDDRLTFGPVADVDKVRDYIGANPSRFLFDQTKTGVQRASIFFDANEDIAAGYVMNRTQLGKLMFILGARLENTQVDYKANQVFRYNKAVLDDPANTAKDPHWNGGQLPTGDAAYTDYLSTQKDSTVNYLLVLPNVQLKWDISPNMIARVAWTTGYSRPNLGDLVPRIDINTSGAEEDPDGGKVTMGNPDLKPAYANNIDVLGEWYLNHVGLISGGFFYKNIDKFIYKNVTRLDDPANPYYNFNDPTLQPQVVQTLNGDRAKVYGVEINLNSALAFLPGPLGNLVFTSNYTYTRSEAKVRSTELRADKTRLPGQAENTGNIALAYSDKRLTLQVSANYNDKFIYALGAVKEQDLWVAQRWQIDVNGSFQITKTLKFYAEAINVFDKPAYTYYGNKTHPYELEYTGAFVRCGFTYRF